MKRALSTILILLAALFVSCVRDDESTPSRTALTDTTLVLALIDSSYESSYSDPNRAIKFADSALSLSNRLDFIRGEAGAHGELGYAYSVKGEFEKSVDHFEQGIALNRSIGDSVGLVSQLNDLGTTQKSQSHYSRALQYYFEALDICQRIGLKRGVSATLGNIGLCFFEMDESDKALKYYQKALKINRELGNKSSLAVNYNNIGLLYGDEGRYDEAIRYHEKALKLRRELGYTIEIANSLNNIGRLYMQQDRDEDALEYLEQAKKVNQRRDPDLSSIIQENITKSFISAGLYDSALVHANRTLALSKDYGTELGMKVAYELRSNIYRAVGDYKKAYADQQKLMAVKDSILNARKAEQINELQTKYETAQKEKEIAILEQQKKQEALLRNAFLAGLLLIGIIAVLVYNRQRLKIRKNRAELENRALKEQQLEKDLEFRNKELTTHTLHLVQKNEAMKELKERIGDIQKQQNGDTGRSLQKLQNLVDYSFNLDEDWEQFRLYFEEVHTGFFDVLKDKYPKLTSNELRLAALAKLSLSIKETATILGITPDSVKTARHRLRKKLKLETEENLSEFLTEIEKERKI